MPLIAIVSLLLPFLPLSPLASGIFIQTDSLITSLWLLSAFGASFLYYLTFHYPFLVVETFAKPLVFFPFLLGILSIPHSFFSHFPLQTWIGSKYIAEGVLTFFAQGILGACVYIACRTRHQKSLLYLALTLGTIYSLLTITGHDNSAFIALRKHKFTPFSFPDFIGFVVIAMVLFLIKLSEYFNKKLWLLGGWLVICFITYYAENRAIWLSLAVGLILIVAQKIIINWSNNKGKLSVLACNIRKQFLPISYVITLIGIVMGLLLIKTLYHHYNSIYGYVYSLVSRNNLALVTILHYFYDFKWADLITILFGNGYGYFHHLNVENLYLLSDWSLFQGDSWNPSWEILDRDLLHSHNTIIETFSALGLSGIAVYLLQQYYLIKNSANKAYNFFYIIIFGVLSSFWYQLPNTLPYTILAFALIKQKKLFDASKYLRQIRFFLLLIIPLLIAGAIGYGLVSQELYNLSRKDEPKQVAHSIEKFNKSPWVKIDLLTGGDKYLDCILVFKYYNKNFLKTAPDHYLENTKAMLENVYNTTGKFSIHARIAVLNSYNDLFATLNGIENFCQKHPDLLNDWIKVTTDFIQDYPLRYDMSCGLMSYLLTHNNFQELDKIIKLILEKNSNNALGLWFKGLYQLQKDRNTAEGMNNIKKSIKNGVNRFIPIPPALRLQLGLQ